jgi:putative ABC transport system substrate-binding protein
MKIILDFRFWIEIPFFPRLWERARVRALPIVHGTLTSILSHGERRNNQRRKTMRRRILSVVLATILLATIFPAEAQQPAKIPKIGFLGAGLGSAAWHGTFQREFRKLGYVDGKNVTFIYRFADTKYDRLSALADELVRLKVDLIIMPGAVDGSDPVTLGLVDSLARPGGNITGFAALGSVLAGKRLELRKETIPKLSRVAVL